MSRLAPLVLPFAALLLLAGCGGGGNGNGGSDGGTGPGATDVVIEEEGTTGAGPFQSEEFEPAVSFTLPEDWRAREEFGMIQAFRGAGEAQALTFESTGEAALAARVEQMRGTPELQASEAEELTVGGHPARRFEAEPGFAMAIEGTEYFALGQGPIRVWVVDVEGSLVTIVAESSVLRTERREAEEIVEDFFADVDRILEGLEFTPGAGGGTDTGSDTGTDTGTGG